MAFDGKIVVPLSWCDSSLDPYYRKMGFAIINDPALPNDTEIPEPQLLPSKLYFPILANLNLGFFAGQATAKDGCPSVISWKNSPIPDQIRTWAKKYGVAKECPPLPSQLRELMVELNIPISFGRAIAHECLRRVMRFVDTHISIPKYKSVGETRPSSNKTIHLTIASLAREGVFDNNVEDVGLFKFPQIHSAKIINTPIIEKKKSSPSATQNYRSSYADEENEEESVKRVDVQNVHTDAIYTKPVTKKNSIPTTSTSTDTDTGNGVSRAEMNSSIQSILDKYNEKVAQLLECSAMHQKYLHQSAIAINGHDDKLKDHEDKINEHEDRLDAVEKGGIECIKMTAQLHQTVKELKV
ncbi:unnamed protein product [Zymoseptoria tritici ST99CH_3D7]|uniref:Uncharacterized protein n=1 Tax=Zymoseptoria tritici (strain ST99CH_3D7) TaxID=1276538 RepID=A0A1X7SA86_ZYMT9|nr:unnamed protein product [Zymoseptoria tritici ST99CH_3D7]